MSRRRSFLYAAIKASEAAARQHAVAERRQASAAVRAVRERERDARRQAVNDRAQTVLHGERQVDSLNTDLSDQIEELISLLTAGLAAARVLDFATLKREPEITPLVPGKLGIAEPAPTADKYLPASLEGLHQFLPWEKRAHAQATALAERHFIHDVQKHAEREAARQKALAEAVTAHQHVLENARQEAAEWNAKVDDFAREYDEGAPSAITDYCRFILEHSDYPGAFPKTVKIAYLPESKQLVLEYDCPTIDVVPAVATYKYVKSKNQVTSTQRPIAQRRALYASVVAQMTLRTLNEVFVADSKKYVDTVAFNGHVNAIDKGTGQQVYPCIVTEIGVLGRSRDVRMKAHVATKTDHQLMKNQLKEGRFILPVVG